MVGVGVEIDAWQIIKDIAGKLKNIKDAPLRKEMDGLVDTLIAKLRKDQLELFELEKDKRNLEKKVDELEDLLRKEEYAETLRKQLIRDDYNPWLALPDDTDPTARYCMLCWDVDGKLIRLYIDESGWHEKVCKKCGKSFVKK
jgi:hypothetical protein